ncbi:Bax inhibitor-1/YccA family protein [Pseudokineococcus marinus]|uniref:Bax inhibitor-1/YccA family protein n=1 Tax=Pseudokineococcus marinus TaxID=351215 RepID=A0A849BXX9_9ACTN|nr:Bax inhibitor-1/YccA family protein [Pseudokineococcus marinus]NNH24286.1 Bax inhibitor-1/YccA family protein [Pseudokineococcus marinus]
MQSSNPVFKNDKAFSQGGYATFDTDRRGRGQAPTWGGSGSAQDMTPQQLQDMYAQPSAGAAQRGRMTYDDVVVRTGALFGVLLVAAAATWVLTPVGAGLGFVLPAMLVAAGLGIWAQLSKKIRPGVMMAYALLMGIALGAISQVYEAAFAGVVPAAVLGTLGAFAAMLVAYKTKLVRATPKFVRFMSIAVMGYLAVVVVNLLVAVFTGSSIYTSPLGWLFSLIGVGLASFMLIIDFDVIEQGVKNGLPQQFAWKAAFGLVTTLVWLYVEMLRLLAILRGND